jgi:phosphate transport system substrate-binding protein
VNRTPGQKLDPKVQEFLRYILSEEGQQEVVREGDFLPLSEEIIRKQLSKMD